MKAIFFGLGGIGQRHARNLRALLGDSVDIIAYRVRRLQQVVTDKLDIEQGAEVERKYNIRAFDNLDAALEQKPTVAFICNPTSLHLATAMKAAHAGCHLFIEKPLSHSMDGVDDLIALADQKKLVGLVTYQLRFHPCVKRLRELLQAGAIGPVLAVRAEVGEYLPGWHQYEDYRQMYAARADLGGGVVLSQIHEMDYLYWMFGVPKRIFAIGGKLSSLAIDVEDVASITLECEVDGRRIPVHVHEDYIQRPPSRTCQVIGDQGKILVDFRALSVTLYNGKGELTEQTSYAGLERNQLFLDEMTHFLSCICGENKPMVSLRDGAQSLKMALAAKASIASGKVVELS